MDFKSSLESLAGRIDSLKEQIATEEATKNAFIMPFIQMLGYDVFNPTEVIPEMDCDLVKKKGDKIDYAIMQDGEPIMLIECKAWNVNLDLHSTQLQKYYVASKAKFGVLTNGIIYRFYADLVKTNIMDEMPFLEVNICNLTSAQVSELEKFCKSNFDVENILSSASELKYISAIKNAVKEEFQNPSQELVKLLSKKVYDGAMKQKVMEQFAVLVKRALKLYVNEAITDRFNAAIGNREEAQEEEAQEEEPKIITTQTELEGFYIVKSILRHVVDVERVTYRDAQTYFAIFLDNNNRKPICRLHFNNEDRLKIELIDENKKGKIVSIGSLEDIYQYGEILEAAVKMYL